MPKQLAFRSVLRPATAGTAFRHEPTTRSTLNGPRRPAHGLVDRLCADPRTGRHRDRVRRRPLRGSYFDPATQDRIVETQRLRTTPGPDRPDAPHASAQYFSRPPLTRIAIPHWISTRSCKLNWQRGDSSHSTGSCSAAQDMVVMTGPVQRPMDAAPRVRCIVCL